MTTTSLGRRAAAYVKATFGGREVFTNPKGHEPGFYHWTESDHGNYYHKIAYLVTAEEARRNGHGDRPFIVDVTGDSDEILKYLD